MGEGSIVWLAVFGGVVAAACAVACACACAWLARATRASSLDAPPRTGATTVYIPQSPSPITPPQPTYVTFPTPMQQPVHHVHHAPVAAPFGGAVAHSIPAVQLSQVASMGHVNPMSMDRIPDHVVFDNAHVTPAGAHATTARSPIVLEGRYPQLGAALGTWLQVEPDEVERIRIARDLGTIGGAGSARALLDGVRTGVLSPTIASDQLERGGFEAGIAVAAALRDPEPRVRALATSLVGRSTPLEPARMTQQQMPPMPDPSEPHPPRPNPPRQHPPRPSDPNDPRA